MWSLKVSAKYTGSQYTKVGELMFTVEFTDPCADAELTIGSGIISSISLEYSLNSGK